MVNRLALLIALTFAAGAALAQEPAGLATPVVIEAVGEPLPTVLEKLGAPAKVRLTAVQHLADQRVTVIAGERPLRRHIDAIAAVFATPQYAAFWTRENADRPDYQLFQDARAAAAAVRTESLARDRERIGVGLASLIQLALSGAEPQPGNTGDPVRDTAIVGKNWQFGLRALLLALGSLSPEQQRAVLRGEKVTTPLAQFSPEAQQAVLSDIIRDGRGLVRTADGSFRRETDAERDASVAALTITLHLTMSDDRALWLSMLEFQSPAHLAGGRGVRVAPVGVGGPVGQPQPAQPPASVADRPLRDELAQGTGRDGAWKEFAEFQAAVAKLTGMPVVSDYFHGIRGPAAVKLAEARTLGELLDAACKASNYQWWVEDGALIFRRRSWYLDEEHQIPATIEIRIAKAMEQRGYLTLDEMAGIAAGATDSQLETLEQAKPEWGSLALLGMARPVLAFYAALSPAERALARRKEGLRLAQANPRAQAAVLAHEAAFRALLVSDRDRELATLAVAVWQDREDETLWTHVMVRPPSGGFVDNRIRQVVRPAEE